jgi:ubiquinone/menaquinone biosynthesis C-methylase UbiE
VGCRSGLSARSRKPWVRFRTREFESRPHRRNFSSEDGERESGGTSNLAPTALREAMLNYENSQAQNTFSYLKDFISENDTVLDCGTGNGLVAMLIRKNIKSQATGIDVININCTKSKTILFNGQDIPFKNNSFTVTVCAFVLHHARNQNKLLKEIKRVTRSKIIIFEDTPQTFLDHIFGFLHKFPSIFRYQSARIHLKSDRAWRDLFRSEGLVLNNVQIIKRTRNFAYPISRRMYVLGK